MNEEQKLAEVYNLLTDAVLILGDKASKPFQRRVQEFLDKMTPEEKDRLQRMAWREA